MQGKMVLDIRAAVQGTIENEIKEIVTSWENAKYGSEIRDAGIATVGSMDLIRMQQERGYKFTRRHAWRSRARGRRRRYF